MLCAGLTLRFFVSAVETDAPIIQIGAFVTALGFIFLQAARQLGKEAHAERQAPKTHLDERAESLEGADSLKEITHGREELTQRERSAQAHRESANAREYERKNAIPILAVRALLSLIMCMLGISLIIDGQLLWGLAAVLLGGALCVWQIRRLVRNIKEGGKMNYTIREIEKSEIPLLSEFIYESIFTPDGVAPPEKSVVNHPSIQVYVEDFGTRDDDFCLVAECGGAVIGAAWVRIMNDFGHVDDETPSLAMALFKQYRGFGIGTALLCELLTKLKAKGYKKTSLSVQKENYAVSMYRNLGYVVFDEN